MTIRVEPPPPPPPSPSGSNIARIVGLVLLALVVLCGLAGSCLLLFSLALPLFGAQQ